MNVILLLEIRVCRIHARIKSGKITRIIILSEFFLSLIIYLFSCDFRHNLLFTYLFKWITSTGGNLEISNFLTASRCCLHFGQVHPSMISPLKYKSKQSYSSHCRVSCGSSKLKCENPSYVALSKPHVRHFTVLRICPKNNFWMILCIFFENSHHATSDLWALSLMIVWKLKKIYFEIENAIECNFCYTHLPLESVVPNATYRSKWRTAHVNPVDRKWRTFYVRAQWRHENHAVKYFCICLTTALCKAAPILQPLDLEFYSFCNAKEYTQITNAKSWRKSNC